MNQYAEKFRCRQLESNLQFGLDVMDAGKRQFIAEGAMTRHVQAVAHARKVKIATAKRLRAGSLRMGKDVMATPIVKWLQQCGMPSQNP